MTTSSVAQSGGRIEKGTVIRSTYAGYIEGPVTRRSIAADGKTPGYVVRLASGKNSFVPQDDAEPITQDGKQNPPSQPTDDEILSIIRQLTPEAQCDAVEFALRLLPDDEDTREGWKKLERQRKLIKYRRRHRKQIERIMRGEFD